jgi:hypothetical protein
LFYLTLDDRQMQRTKKIPPISTRHDADAAISIG